AVLPSDDFAVRAADAHRDCLDEDLAVGRVGFGQVGHDPGRAGPAGVHDQSPHERLPGRPGDPSLGGHWVVRGSIRPSPRGPRSRLAVIPPMEALVTQAAWRATPADPWPSTAELTMAEAMTLPRSSGRSLPPEFGPGAIAVLEGVSFMYSDSNGDVPSG